MLSKCCPVRVGAAHRITFVRLGGPRRPLVRDYWSTPFLLKTKKTRLVLGRHRANAKSHHLKRNAKDFSKSKVSATAPRKNKKEQERQPYTQTAQPPFSMFVSCLPGLEPLLLGEVENLQSQWNVDSAKTNQNAKAIPGGVELIVPTLAHMYILHLYLGTASHIYLRLNDGQTLFRARGFPEFKKKLKHLIISQQWNQLFGIPSPDNRGNVEERHLPWDLNVHVTCSKSKLMHTKAVEERTRETIRQVLGSSLNNHEDENTTRTKEGRVRPIVRILVRIQRDVVQLSLDTSSSGSAIPLHMRGYRLNPFKAPLREDLAFALSLVGGLKLNWNLQPLRPLLPDYDRDAVSAIGTISATNCLEKVRVIDPFCGSGTIAIESASILAGLPPGRFRPPPLRGTSLYNPKLWDEMKSQALQVSLQSKHGSSSDGSFKSNPVLVAANDKSQHAIVAAKSNAKRAGVDHLIDFKTGSYKVHPLLNTSGQSEFNISDSEVLLVVTNPPYGNRLSTSNDSYKKFAQALFHSPFHTCCTIIGKDPRLLRKSSLALKVALSTKQGGLNVVMMTEVN